MAVAEVHDLSDRADISGGFFYAHDIVNIFYKVSQCLRLDAAAGAARYIIQDSRNLHRITDLCIMGDESVLCRFIIVRSYKEKTVGSVLFCLF